MEISLEKIERLTIEVAKRNKTDLATVYSKSQKAEPTATRQQVWYILKKYQQTSLIKMTEVFDRNHASVSTGCKRVQSLIDTDKKYREHIRQIDILACEIFGIEYKGELDPKIEIEGFDADKFYKTIMQQEELIKKLRDQNQRMTDEISANRKQMDLYRKVLAYREIPERILAGG